jgi:cytoskeleton protein RodZ
VDIGAKLQRARISRGCTLAQISNATKLSSHVLQRIETGDFDQLRGGLLTRGYLRAFASEVGLDPEEVVSEYRAEFERTPPEDEPFKLRSSYEETDARAPGVALMLTIALAVIIYFAFVKPAQRPSEMDTVAEHAAIDVDAAPTIEHAVAPAQRAQPGGQPPVAAASEGLRIELRPHTECWVSATADGRLVIYRLMQGGERETIDALQEIVLRVGDAGALAYVVNGGAGRSLGASREAVTVRITSDNAATWLTKEPAGPAAGTPETIASTPHITGI